VSARTRRTVFLASAAAVAALLVWGVSGLPDFGEHQGAAARLLNRTAVDERHATNVVSAVVFDYRGVDTMGEEFILFASAMGVALLLRDVRDEQVRRRPTGRGASDALRLIALGAVGAVVVVGLAVVAHGHLTPGGGFQGGVVLAAAAVLVYLGSEYGLFRRALPNELIDLGEGGGAGAYVVLGCAGLVAGSAFLDNVLPFGTAGTLASGGTIPLLNLAVALEVAAAFVLLFTELAEEMAALELPGRS
jgi:multicomponent Na+:H+ antiporter subunit B